MERGALAGEDREDFGAELGLGGVGPGLQLRVHHHHYDVAEVQDHHDHALVPIHLFRIEYLTRWYLFYNFFHYHLLINENSKECDDCETVDEAISRDGIPVQLGFPPGKDATDGDDPKDVEHGRADNGADPEIALGHESPHHIGEEFRGACSWENGKIV